MVDVYSYPCHKKHKQDDHAAALSASTTKRKPRYDLQEGHHKFQSRAISTAGLLDFRSRQRSSLNVSEVGVQNRINGLVIHIDHICSVALRTVSVAPYRRTRGQYHHFVRADGI